MGFWDFFWLLIWSYFFVAFLVALFQIVGDLFKDQELSGWFKGLWMVGLIVFPILGALLYLAIRGRSMAERQAHAAIEARDATNAYIQSVAKQSDPVEQITAAKSLLDSGTITQAEFDGLKMKALT